MIASPLVVEQQCPQCGAAVELAETDRLLACPYCRVRLCIHSDGPAWLYLAPREASADDVFYLPYWRFRGARHVLGDASITSRMVDHNLLAAPCRGAPASLGVRPQVLASQFVRPDAGVRMVAPSLTQEDYLERLRQLLWQTDRMQISMRSSLDDPMRPPSVAMDVFTASWGEPLPPMLQPMARAPFVPFDRAEQDGARQYFIGEAITVLCSPFRWQSGKLLDGVTGEVVGAMPDGPPELVQAQGASLSFHASLCPDCGHDLAGERHTMVMVCAGCGAAWQAAPGGFSRVPYEIVEPAGDEDAWVPFWRISVEVPELQLTTLGELMRFANQSVPVPRELLDQPLAFWIPATKAAPESFLRWARVATLRQRAITSERLPDNLVRATELHPVTLPVTEAIEAIPVVLASSCVAKRRRMAQIKTAAFAARVSRLVMVPFRRSTSELVQPRMGFTMQRNTLGWCKDL